jgi:two-component system, LytTR family, response regulator AlgR
MTLRILIVDDEPLARARLRALVEELGHEVCAEAANAADAEHALADAHPDAMLLDIQMPHESGLSLARRLRAQRVVTPVVLVTAHAEHALAAFEAAATDYVLKPVRKERLSKALTRIEEQLDVQKAPILIRLSLGRKEQLVPLHQIDCFVTDRGYVMARSAVLHGFVDAHLTELEHRFPTELIRVHRSCLAVITAIAGIEQRPSGDHCLIFRDGLQGIPVSRRNASYLKEFTKEKGGVRRPI